ncbi:MAG: LpxL/LpxP family Kdo(2)-lipid IV(A) lauroyl/palmitoleoyl acyltransferase [Gammaproteobacteria bacterium]|nr:LpxL/LpxP family Kdo(2)-lipid IV(A) lauroyl/palmitoleoyl acyltransferase [Gammaproteobacteria bacterium]
MTTERSLSRFIAPRWWPYWLGLGVMRLLAFLPYRVHLALGGGLGALMFRLMRKRREVAARNLAVCFPERSAENIAALTRTNFRSLGIAFFEMILAWWAGRDRLARIMTLEGLEHLTEALTHGRGAILVSAHFTTLEICGPELVRHIDADCMYRPNRNPFIDEILRRGRERVARRTIRKDDARAMLRRLRENGVVWYAPDQAYWHKHGALVPFFGIPCWTNTGTSRLAKLSGAPVLPYICERLPGTAGYRMVIGEPLADFPTNDPVADSARLNRMFEAQIRAVPEQYLWVHRRFKRLPPPHDDIYAGL